MTNNELKSEAILLSEKLRKINVKKDPFPFLLLDQSFSFILSKNASEFPNLNDPENWDVQSDNVEKKHRSNWKSEFDIPENILPIVRILNSSTILRTLSDIFNIPKLLPDPFFTGGGLNVSLNGGKLGVHVDGNYHDASGLNRRLNIILFLSESWDESWGGEFGLYDSSGKKCIKKIYPVFNRLLIFVTNDKTFHGHPEPIKCPENVLRKSLILYYYTKDARPEEENIFEKPHRALWVENDIKDKDGNLSRNIYE